MLFKVNAKQFGSRVLDFVPLVSGMRRNHARLKADLESARENLAEARAELRRYEQEYLAEARGELRRHEHIEDDLRQQIQRWEEFAKRSKINDRELRDQIEQWQQSVVEHVRLSAYKTAFKGETPGRPRALPSGSPAPAAREFNRARPTLSVVLGTFNRLELLKIAIDSIRCQKFDKPLEIIVVDGGSTDGSKEWLTAQEDIVTIVQNNRDPIGKSARKQSWGYFMNLAFRAASGKWICMMSDDCILSDGCLAAGIDTVEEKTREGKAVGGGAFFFRDWPDGKGYFTQHTLGGMLMVNHGLFLREALEDVGFADDQLYDFYKADSDLSLKIWYAGYEICPCTSSFVDHLLLPSEQLRIENNKALEADRLRLAARWEAVFVSSAYPRMFHAPHQNFCDRPNDGHAEQRFRPMLEADYKRSSDVSPRETVATIV